ncbi:hypothetical protein CRG98_043016 [Punica granatum]|uniref:Uncharacterized protein n=1 Tax=Punica granatum TaxID=22663 RepID=A0A2I0HZB5_PUNGR|nr:hypothetical protein CRG98_043016 [Punica granatum]
MTIRCSFELRTLNTRSIEIRISSRTSLMTRGTHGLPLGSRPFAQTALLLWVIRVNSKLFSPNDHTATFGGLLGVGSHRPYSKIPSRASRRAVSFRTANWVSSQVETALVGSVASIHVCSSQNSPKLDLAVV